MSVALSSMVSQAQPASHGPDVPDTFLGSILHGNPIFSAGFGLMVMGGAPVSYTHLTLPTKA